MSKHACSTVPPFALDEPKSNPPPGPASGRRHQTHSKGSPDDLDSAPSSKRLFERRQQLQLIRPQTGCPGHLADKLRFSPKTEALERLRRSEEQQAHKAALEARRQHRVQQEQQHDQKERAQAARADQLLAMKASAAAARAAALARSQGHGFDIISFKDKTAPPHLSNSQ